MKLKRGKMNMFSVFSFNSSKSKFFMYKMFQSSAQKNREEAEGLRSKRESKHYYEVLMKWF